MERWYCVHTRPRAEAQAREHLRRQGFEVLLPRLARTVLRAGRRQPLLEPLFPRYLFLRADAETNSLAPVRWSRGVVDLVRVAGVPATVPEGFIVRLAADADAEGVIVLPGPNFHPGERLLITEGPLAGLQGLYERAEGEHRVTLLIELLGGAQEVRLPRDALQPAGAACAA